MNSSIRFRCPILILLSLAFLLSAVDHSPQVAGLLEQLKSASTAADVERVAAEVQATALAPGDESAGTLLDALAQTWYRHARYPEALALFEQLVVSWPESASLTYLKMAQIHRVRGDEEREIETLRASIRQPKVDTHLDVMDADNTSNIAYRRLGQIYENRGEWTKALVFWKHWEPTSWCGNEAAAYDHQRTMGIARCQFHLKDVDGALRSVWSLVAEIDCLNGPHPGAAFLYAELSAKADRLEQAHRDMRRLPQDRRERFMVSIDVWQGYKDKDPRAILDALDHFRADDLRWLKHSAPLEIHEATRLLTDLGSGAAAEVEGRIRAGDLHAVAVAGISANQDFAPALRVLANNKDADEDLRRTVGVALELLTASPEN